MSDFLNGVPYTNFHELNADWMLTKVKEASDNWAASMDKIDNMESEVTELKKYLANNLDASVKVWMDEYLDDGTLASWVQEYMTNLQHKAATLTDGTLGAMIRIANSFLAHTDELMYMHMIQDDPSEEGVYQNYGTEQNPDYEVRGYNAMMPGHNITIASGGNSSGDQWKVDGDNTAVRSGMAINCSSYVQHLLLGIPYDMSRYSTGDSTVTNIGAAGYCCNMFNGPVNSNTWDGHLRSREMYKDFFTAGQAELINSNYPNINVGDIVFMGSTNDPDPDNAGITHCGLVLAKTGAPYIVGDETEPLYLITECLNQAYAIQNNMYYSADATHHFREIIKWTHVAHPYYGAVPEAEGELLGQFDVGLTLNNYNAQFSFSTDNYSVLDKTVLNGEILTVEFDWDGTQTVEFRPDNRSRFTGQLKAYCRGSAHRVKAYVVAEVNQIGFSPLYNPTFVAFASTTPIHNLKLYRGTKAADRYTLIYSSGDASTLMSDFFNLIPFLNPGHSRNIVGSIHLTAIAGTANASSNGDLYYTSEHSTPRYEASAICNLTLTGINATITAVDLTGSSSSGGSWSTAIS